MTEKITILVEKPLTYLEMMHGGSWVFRDRKLIEVQVDPITLPYGLWERAEARHRGDTPVKKSLSREDREAARSIMWARHWGKEAVRKKWYAQHEPEGITARFVTIDEAEAWKPQKEIIVTSGRKLMMPYA